MPGYINTIIFCFYPFYVVRGVFLYIGVSKPKVTLGACERIIITNS